MVALKNQSSIFNVLELPKITATPNFFMFIISLPVRQSFRAISAKIRALRDEKHRRSRKGNGLRVAMLPSTRNP